METDPHQQARLLLVETRISGIAPQDTQWLEGHLADCAECALYEENLAGILRGLKSFAFDVDPSMSERMQIAVAARVRKRFAGAWWTLAAAAVLMVAAVPFYRGIRDAQRDKDDTLLMDNVEERVSRVIPIAMEPLRQSPPRGSQ